MQKTQTATSADFAKTLKNILAEIPPESPQYHIKLRDLQNKMEMAYPALLNQLYPEDGLSNKNLLTYAYIIASDYYDIFATAKLNDQQLEKLQQLTHALSDRFALQTNPNVSPKLLCSYGYLTLMLNTQEYDNQPELMGQALQAIHSVYQLFKARYENINQCSFSQLKAKLNYDEDLVRLYAQIRISHADMLLSLIEDRRLDLLPENCTLQDVISIYRDDIMARFAQTEFLSHSQIESISTTLTDLTESNESTDLSETSSNEQADDSALALLTYFFKQANREYEATRRYTKREREVALENTRPTKLP